MIGFCLKHQIPGFFFIFKSNLIWDHLRLKGIYSHNALYLSTHCDAVQHLERMLLCRGKGLKWTSHNRAEEPGGIQAWAFNGCLLSEDLCWLSSGTFPNVFMFSWEFWRIFYCIVQLGICLNAFFHCANLEMRHQRKGATLCVCAASYGLVG